MKFRFAGLLFLHSSAAFLNSPALSMVGPDPEVESSSIGGALRRNPFAGIKADYDGIVRNYLSLRDKGNKAPDPELVGFLFGEENWHILPRQYQKQVVKGVVNRAFDLRLEALMREANVVPKYRAVRAKGNESSNAELVSFLFGKRWEEIKPGRQRWVINEVICSAQELDTEELITQSGVLAKYRFAKAAGNQASDAELVKYFLGERWNKINPDIQVEVIKRVASRSWELDNDAVDSLIKSGKLEKKCKAIKVVTPNISDRELIKQALTKLGFDGPNRLNDKQYLFIIEAVIKKNPIAVLESLVTNKKVQEEGIRTYRTIKDSGNKASDADIVKYVLEQMGFKEWSRLESKFQQEFVQEIIMLAEESLIPKWIQHVDRSFDESELDPLLIGVENELYRRSILRTAERLESEGVDIASRVAAIVANAPTLLKNVECNDHADVIIAALGIEAGEIAARAAIIARNAGVYLTHKMEFINTLMVSLLKADLVTIEEVPKNLNRLLPDAGGDFSRVYGIQILLGARPDQILALVKHADILFKDALGITTIQKAVKLRAEEIDRCVNVINIVCAPDSALQLLFGNIFKYLRPEITKIALDGVTVEQITARAEAIAKNKFTFWEKYFSKPQIDTCRVVFCVASLLAVDSEEINRRAEGVGRHAAVLFPKEINDDMDRAEIMEAVIKVKSDKLDGAIAKVTEAYARVEGTADSSARASVIKEALR